MLCNISFGFCFFDNCAENVPFYVLVCAPCTTVRICPCLAGRSGGPDVSEGGSTCAAGAFFPGKWMTKDFTSNVECVWLG